MARKRSHPFMERLRIDRKTGQLVEAESLRARFPNYAKAFLASLAGALLLGVVIFWLSSMSFDDSLGYALIAMGTLLILLGGARGGGYSNLSIGAIETLAGGRNRMDDDYEEDDGLRRGKVMSRRDPMARLRKGLRPPPNPAAFWQTIGGLLYLLVGLPLTF